MDAKRTITIVTDLGQTVEQAPEHATHAIVGRFDYDFDRDRGLPLETVQRLVGEGFYEPRVLRWLSDIRYAAATHDALMKYDPVTALQTVEVGAVVPLARPIYRD